MTIEIPKVGGKSSRAAAYFEDRPLPKKDEVKVTSEDVTKISFDELTEENLLTLPIEARPFEVPAMLQIKPKESSISFRWVNLKGHEGSNYKRYLSMGFLNANINDVDGMLVDGMVGDDASITYYDVILMKVSKLRLMQAYKAGLLKSINRVNNVYQEARSTANQQLRQDVPGGALAAAKQAGHRVEFYTPSNAEITSQDKDFLNDPNVEL